MSSQLKRDENWSSRMTRVSRVQLVAHLSDEQLLHPQSRWRNSPSKPKSWRWRKWRKEKVIWELPDVTLVSHSKFYLISAYNKKTESNDDYLISKFLIFFTGLPSDWEQSVEESNSEKKLCHCFQLNRDLVASILPQAIFWAWVLRGPTAAAACLTPAGTVKPVLRITSECVYTNNGSTRVKGSSISAMMPFFPNLLKLNYAVTCPPWITKSIQKSAKKWQTPVFFTD